TPPRPPRASAPCSLSHPSRRLEDVLIHRRTQLINPSRGGGPVLIDTYGRVATDLRVSLTDRCNLRCTYCMPEEGLQWLAKPDLLTDDEIVRLIDIAVTSLGIEEVRFTGRQPLLPPGLVRIVDRVAALNPPPQPS